MGPVGVWGISGYPGTINIKTAGSGVFIALQGILENTNVDSTSRAEYRTCMIAANYVATPTQACKTTRSQLYLERRAHLVAVPAVA